VERSLKRIGFKLYCAETDEEDEDEETCVVDAGIDAILPQEESDAPTDYFCDTDEEGTSTDDNMDMNQQDAVLEMKVDGDVGMDVDVGAYGDSSRKREGDFETVESLKRQRVD
jgi:hypothetical protein